MTVQPSPFTYPPVDGSVPPALAIDFHLEHNPSHVFAILHSVDDSTLTEITYELLAHAVHRAAHILNPDNAIPQGTNVGFLVSAHTIEYIIMVMGAMRAGLVPFPISPRTNVSGIAHLITTTQTKYIVAGGSKVIDDITSQVNEALLNSDFHVNFTRFPALESVLPLRTKTQMQHMPFAPLRPFENSSNVSILHSSGSTGMPRAIPYHFEGIFKNIVNQPLGWVYHGNNLTIGTMVLPTFHMMGMMTQIILPLYVGYKQALFASSQAPVMPTADLTIKAAINSKCDYLLCVPVFLEMWAQNDNAIAHLRTTKGVMFGGGPLSKAAGNKLVDRGVNIYSCYGGTEFGLVNAIEDGIDPSDWGYIKFSQRVGAVFEPQYDDDGTFELVFVQNQDHNPFVFNSEVDGKPAHRTKDLVLKHPTRPDLWKIFGRLDDQIVLLTGEKTNPGPMEAEITRSPLVNSAVMFGRGRNQTGVLIELSPSTDGKYSIGRDRAIIIEDIWPYIERANQSSSTHSRLARFTIIIVDPARPVPRTPKGTVSRSAAFKMYAHEIEGMYASLEKGSVRAGEIEQPGSWSDPNAVETWLGKQAEYILGREIDPSEDLFQQGMDSLTATILLRTIKSMLHASPDLMAQASNRQINQQTIFNKPTLRQLTTLLVQLCTNISGTVDPTTKALESMHAMIKKYDSNWIRSNTDTNVGSLPIEKERVVVTGTTGGLGSHLLAQLLASDRVGKVWALNRKSSKDNRARQEAAFEDKMLDVRLLDSKKLVLLDVHLEDARLGLYDQIYDEICDEATLIIHNAWQVNFNFSLQSFEPSIRGARNLLDLAFKSTSSVGMPRLAFMSSISAAGFGEPERLLLETSVKLEHGAAGIGYGQSKLVAEKLLESAREAGLQACSIRLGQLTGDVKSGAWATTDWVPSLISSSVSIGCLPAAVGAVSWLPLDIAARSIMDICTSGGVTLPPVIHVSHPRPVPWVDIMSKFSAALATRASLPLVPFGEWNRRVTESAAAFQGTESDRYRRFPSTKIQGVVDRMVYADEELRARGSSNGESGGAVQLVTSAAQRISQSLRNADRVGTEHVERWVEYWEKMGLFL